MKNRKSRNRIILIMMAARTCLPVPATAGNPLGLLKKLGTLIDTLSVKGVDRNYIDKTERPWQLILKSSVNQSELKMEAREEFEDLYMLASPHLKTEPSRYVGLWAGYRGYGLGYSVNVGGDKGSYFTIGATGGSYGVNVRVHRFDISRPQFSIKWGYDGQEDEEAGEVDLESPMQTNTLIADAYYLFNGRKFSYAAAYDQSVIQKRSAGSFMAGGMYFYSHTNYADDHNADIIELMKNIGRVKTWQGCVGVGYAYNWVPVSGLLVNVMAMPMLTFVNNIKVYGYSTNINELEIPEDASDFTDDIFDKMSITFIKSETRHGNMNLNFDARLSVTYNFGRYFVNAYGQFNNFRYHHNDSHGRLNDWFVNASLGVRL